MVDHRCAFCDYTTTRLSNMTRHIGRKHALSGRSLPPIPEIHSPLVGHQQPLLPSMTAPMTPNSSVIIGSPMETQGQHRPVMASDSGQFRWKPPVPSPVCHRPDPPLPSNVEWLRERVVQLERKVLELESQQRQQDQAMAAVEALQQRFRQVAVSMLYN